MQANAAEILDSCSDFYAADGGARPNSGGTPFRQPCPAYPSAIGRKAPQERFSEESFRTCTSSGNAFLNSSTASPLPKRQQNSQHTTSLDVLAEPNYYSKRARTSSTRVFASHSSDDRGTIGMRQARARIALRLLIPPPASTLQVFQFIRWHVLGSFGTQSQSNVQRGFMGRSLFMSNSRWNLLRLTVAILSLGSVGGCGKSTKAGPPLFPTRVNLTPSSNTSVNSGATFGFTASAQTTAGTTLATTFTLYVQRYFGFECRSQRRGLCRPLGRRFHHLHPRGHRSGHGHGLRAESIKCSNLRIRPSRDRQHHRHRNSADWRPDSGALPLAGSVHDTGGARFQSGFRHHLLRRSFYLVRANTRLW